MEIGVTSADVTMSYALVNFNPMITGLMESGSIGGMITASEVVPFSLRTHLIRHNLLLMRDNLIEIITSHDILSMDLSKEMIVQVSGTIEFWRGLIRKRSCWMSHYGMWKPILDVVSDRVEISNVDLPCAGDGELCPYAKDAMLRYDGFDPGAPCPIHAAGNKIRLSKEQRIDVLDQINRDNRPEFWRGAIR